CTDTSAVARAAFKAHELLFSWSLRCGWLGNQRSSDGSANAGFQHAAFECREEAVHHGIAPIEHLVLPLLQHLLVYRSNDRGDVGRTALQLGREALALGLGFFAR